MTTKTYVWSIYTRIFHILLVVAVGLVFLLAEFENLLSYHVILGYTIAMLFIFRIIWGFMDVKYSNFKDFNFNIKDLLKYMLNVFSKKEHYTGHNPASSWAIIFMIILALSTVISGTIVYGVQEGMGVFSFLNNNLFKDMDIFEDIHELFANTFMAVIFIHISGVILDKVLHNSDSLSSMRDGYKDSNDESLKLTITQKIFGFLWISLSIGFMLFLLYDKSNILIADNNNAIDYKVQNRLFYDECISCHTLYPPHLLPSSSWVKIMDNLEDHFGDDASLEAQDANSIKKYLIKNSANKSTKESAFKLLSSIKNPDTIAITKIPYWEKRHKGIDESVFKNKNVLNKSNCKACHKNFEQGLLNDKDIKIP